VALEKAHQREKKKNADVDVFRQTRATEKAKCRKKNPATGCKPSASISNYH